MLILNLISGNKIDLSKLNLTSNKTIKISDSLLLEYSIPYHQWVNHEGVTFIILGNIVGIRNSEGFLENIANKLSAIQILENPISINDVEGRFLLVKIEPDGTCEIWPDNYGRIDVFYQVLNGQILISTNLEFFTDTNRNNKPDNTGVAHALVIYGSRPAKKHTLYKEIKRIGVYEGLRVKTGAIEILERPLSILETSLFKDHQLNLYADYFLEAIRARASKEGNVVYLSSGWDSTSILAALVHLYGKSKVRCIIGRMQYAERSGIINQFEIDRAKAVAEYFGVKLDIIELDYRKDALKILDKSRRLFRSYNFANLTGINHLRLAEETAKTANGNEVVFAGEMSDGAHNLGFSQFATIFHPKSLEFREYSDKMASYLFGPTFLQEIYNGSYEKDPIWQIFKNLNTKVIFDKPAKDKKSINLQFLSSFFLRSGRLPFYSIKNTSLLSNNGQINFLSETEKTYLYNFAENLTPNNLYATILHLYNSFHWQGATVSTLEYTADAHGLNCVLPFHDKAIIDFLSQMPESWGRGLDFKPTKYPLKWMLQNRIDYPLHLQTGPHSYIYDVNPNFSLLGEILYASSFKPIFIEALKSGKFLNRLDSNFFNKSYIENITNRYINGEELTGQKMSELGSLAFQSVIGLIND